MYNLNIKKMNEESEERIKRKKRQIQDLDYYTKKLGMEEAEREKRIDALLEDLKKLMNERD